MKTSNKLILIAFLIALVSLLIHDYKLKAVYASKSYLNPLNDFVELGFRDFNVIDVNASGVSNVKIVQGPFKVMVKSQERHFISISQNDGHLKIDASFSSKKIFPDRYYDGYRVYISCPSVLALNFDNKYLVDNKPWRDSVAQQYWNRQNIVHGFNIDTMVINEDNGCYLILDSNNIRFLRANTGHTKGSGPILEISKGNKINAANLNVESKSDLHLYSIIPNLEYHLSDSANFYTTGYVGNQLNKK